MNNRLSSFYKFRGTQGGVKDSAKNWIRTSDFKYAPLTLKSITKEELLQLFQKIDQDLIQHQKCIAITLLGGLEGELS